MVTPVDDAGVGVVRPLPSRSSGSFDTSRPLQLLLEHRQTYLQSLASLQAGSFWFGALNLLPKVALDKVHVEQRGEFLLLTTPDEAVRVLPLTADKGIYYVMLTDLLAAKRHVRLIPDWVAQHIRKGNPLKKQQDEYLIATKTLQTLPGGSLRAERNLVHRSRRVADPKFGADDLAALKALNATWYRQNADTKFRTYDKTSIDWLLDNWPDLAAALPDARILSIWYDGQPISFTMASMLAADTWSAYTERFDRQAPIAGSNWRSWSDLAFLYDAEYNLPYENDGTADTPQLRRNKSKLTGTKVSFWETL